MPIHAYVVDDESVIQNTLLKLLEQEHYVVQAFATAEAFLAQADITVPHVLIVDKNLPGMSGLELIDQHNRAGHDFEAILITGYADLDSAIHAVRLGLYSYLRKPFEYEDLLADVVGASRRLKKRTSRELPVVEQIREPLASASSLLEALRLDEDLLPDNAQSTLELALESLQSAEDVVVEQEIEQKLRSRQADLRPLNLVQTLRATVQPLTELSRAERAPIWLEVDQEVQVVADPSLLPRMLQTILEMVIRVSAFGRPLMMDLEQAGSRVTLQIIGQGGTVAQLRQVNPRALTMCEQLARLQGGQVTIQPYLVDVGVSCQIELAVAGG